jgi:fluoride exporter
MPSSEPRPELVTSSSSGIIAEVRDPFYVNILLIAIGGALGSVARYLLSSFVLRASGTLFPLGTFVVNLVGCVVFGTIVGAATERFVLTPEARAFLLIGVLGGFTTFSSYAFESVALLRDGQFLAATVNIVGQVVAGLIGMWAGIFISR